MRTAVSSRFLAFTKPLEGQVEYMYVDVKGLVTIGFGNLIDPLSAALALPFVHKKAETPANRTEITAEWNLIKDAGGTRGLKTKGHRACAPLTNLKLTDATIATLCSSRLRANEADGFYHRDALYYPTVAMKPVTM